MADFPDLLAFAPSSPCGAAEWLRLLLLTGRCHRRLNQGLAGPDGSTAAELLLLACAAELGASCQQSELVETLGSSPAHVSGLVERLRQRGWMTADRAADDRRRQCWRIAPPGMAVLRELQLASYAAPDIGGDLPELLRLLERLDAALGALTASNSSPLPVARNSA